MKHVIKLTTIKGVTVEAKGGAVAIDLSNGFLTINELLTPDAAFILGEALVREASSA